MHRRWEMPISLLKENRPQQDFLEHIFEGLPDLMLITDEQGSIEGCNAAIRPMFGFEPGEVRGRPISAMIGEAQWATIAGLFHLPDKASRARQLRLGRRITGKRKDRTAIPISINVAEFERGQGSCFIFVVRDITQILNTELELERSNEELQNFAAVASHDLQAPLRTITTFATSILAKQDVNLDEDSRTKLSRIVSACGRMRDLTDSLLELARITRKERQFEAVNVNDAFDDVARDLSSLIAESGARVTRSDLPRVQGDRAQIRQVLQNFVTNALKFRREGVAPEVSVSAEPDGSFWRLSVTDNGIGIDKAYHAKIFGLFQRLHGKSQYAGSGIGLAMVKKIVERHGGSVGLSSKPGEGSRFWFTLPAAGEWASRH